MQAGVQADDSGTLQELYVANSGTTVRFLAAALSAAGGRYRLLGVERMHQRPIGDLVDAVQMVIDGSIQAISPLGCPPVEIRCSGWKGNKLGVGGSVSSQYLSGLMMAAPLGWSGWRFLRGRAGQDTAQAAVNADSCFLVNWFSRPYVDMTANVMRSFGGKLRLRDEGLTSEPMLVVEVEAGGYLPTAYEIETGCFRGELFFGLPLRSLAER